MRLEGVRCRGGREEPRPRSRRRPRYGGRAAREHREDSDELFISAYDLARIFKATKFWNAGNRKLVLRIGNHRYMFTIDTRVVVVDEAPVLLRLNVRYDRDAIMIPLEFITGVLAPRMAEKVSLDPGRLLLSIGSPEYNVTAIEILDDKTAREPSSRSRRSSSIISTARLPGSSASRLPEEDSTRSDSLGARGRRAPQPGESRADASRTRTSSST